MPYKTVMLVSQRTKKLDALTSDFLAEHPDAVVLHPGCGLDARFWRVDNGLVEWYDLDMPQVTDLRRQFFPGNARYHLISSSVTDLDWISQVDVSNRPVLVVAEGLLMYLQEADVKRLLLQLRRAFPNYRLAADVFSRLRPDMRPNMHPSIRPGLHSVGALMIPMTLKPGDPVSGFWMSGSSVRTLN